MSLMDKIKSFFSGGSSADAHDHSGHDHSGHDHAGHEHDHSHDPTTALPPTDPSGVPMSKPSSDAGEDRPA